MALETVKKEEQRGKQLTLGEKKNIASSVSAAASSVSQPQGVPIGAVRTTVAGTLNGAPVRIDNATNLEVAKPDDDIKNMLVQLQGNQQFDASGMPVLGGSVDANGMPIDGGLGGSGSGLPPISANILAGMLHTVYMMPSYIYRVEYHPDEFTIKVKAQQLSDILMRYGITDVKYIDLLFFAGGLMGDMAGVAGHCKELKEEKDKAKKVEREVRESEETVLRNANAMVKDTQGNTGVEQVRHASDIKADVVKG